MDALRITEAELVRDLHQVLTRLRAGEEVVVDGGERPLVLRGSEQRFRTLGDAIAGLKAIEAEQGYPVMMDEDFAADMREIIANRKPRRSSAWD